MIRIVNLDKIYTSSKGDTVALKNINLQINDGEIFGIIGLSGAGKSTLIRCINLLEKPTSGEIYINDVDITKVSKKELLKMRTKIGMIFQNFNLLEQKTVLQNVLFPLEINKVDKETAKAKALELIKLVGLETKANNYPSQLSGGEKQRVAIAGVLAIRPKILILDEATSMLDPRGRSEVNEVIRRLNKEDGITVITVTHYMEEALNADKVIVTNNGKIAFSGTPEEVFSREKDIESCGLCLPRAMYIANRLKEKNILDKNLKCYTVEELEKALCELFVKI